MKRLVNSKGRTYRSNLRAEQAEDTRTRVLEATLRLMTDGMASFSIPAVARDAGVSVPTIYRHFGRKSDLLAALYPHVAKGLGVDQVPDPASVGEVRDAVRAIFDRLDALDDLTRAAMASPGADAVRHATMPRRFERIRRLGDSIEPKLADADLDRITRLLVILTSSSALRTWRDHLGSSVDEAADDVDWVLRAAIAAARTGSAR